MKSGKDIVFYFRPDVISFTWRGKRFAMRGKPSSPLFSLCPWKRIFRASFLGVKIRRISLNNAFTPSFSAPLYILYNNVS